MNKDTMMNHRWLWFSVVISIASLIGSLSIYSIFLTLLAPLAFLTAWLWMRQTASIPSFFAVGLSALAIGRLLWVVFAVNPMATEAGNLVFEYQIPEDYSGWVVIEYDVFGAEPLYLKDQSQMSAYVHTIPADGMLRTSTELPYERENYMARYRFYTPDHARPAFDATYMEGEHRMVRVGCEQQKGNLVAFYVFDQAYADDSDMVQQTCASVASPLQ